MAMGGHRYPTISQTSHLVEY